jgi:hypothetical protein
VQICIDPKTVELSAALHGILHATQIAAEKFPNVSIKAINVGSNFIRVETTDSNHITVPGNC